VRYRTLHERYRYRTFVRPRNGFASGKPMATLLAAPPTSQVAALATGVQNPGIHAHLAVRARDSGNGWSSGFGHGRTLGKRKNGPDGRTVCRTRDLAVGNLTACIGQKDPLRLWWGIIVLPFGGWASRRTVPLHRHGADRRWHPPAFRRLPGRWLRSGIPTSGGLLGSVGR